MRTTVFGRIPAEDEEALIAPIDKKLAQNDISTQEYVGYVADIMSIALPAVGLFVDDVLINIQTARSLSIHTIHADKSTFGSAPKPLRQNYSVKPP